MRPLDASPLRIQNGRVLSEHDFAEHWPPMLKINPNTDTARPAAILLAAFFLLAAAPLAHAQNSTGTAPLTPAQQTYIDTEQSCIQQFNAQSLPKSRFHSFMNACFRQNGIEAAVPLPVPGATVTQQSQ